MTSKWDLSFIYKGHDDPKIDEDLNYAEQLADDLNKYRGKIKSGELSTEEFLNLLQQVEEVNARVRRGGAFGSLLFAQETINDEYKAFYGRMQNRSVEISNKLIWIELEINEMSEESVGKYLQDPVLANYHHFIKVQRLSKPYLLSEPVEQVLSQKNLVGAKAWTNFYNEYTSAFQFEVEIEGKVQTLSPGEIRPLFRHPNPEVRENVFKTYYQKYADESIAINHSFNNIWKDHGQNVDLRKYPSTLTIAHIRNQVDEKIVDTMMEVIKKNYSLVQDYYKSKARLMGQGDKIKGSDLYAPIGKAVKYTWEEAKQLVIDAYTEFDSEFGELTQYLLENNRVDSEVRKNKMTGAFCAGILPELDPVILMSFDETTDGVSTLAHEIGHALHDLFSGRKQTLLNYSPPLVAAETASVFGEQILIEKLLETLTDEETKLKLLASQLEDAIATISRQTMYVFWEKECHEKGAQENLSTKQHSDLWDSYVQEAYGDAVDFLPEQSWNWATIPHFLQTRFYCYAYSFGMLFVLGLYQQFQREGEAFIPKYKQILEVGGSKFPVELAASVGLDITVPEFWQAGFDYLQKLLSEFQEIVEKRTK
ncbi:MAG: M3 family oligoendopeptidase [Candidatus Heimdallarchaeota archaeon]|nr:MAG: M3 family oligoendopeptidase [Candidatus Heimdallarchaeota archaeon]